MPRFTIAIGQISHETNTFSPIPTPLAAFQEGRGDILEGQALIENHQGSKSGLGGFLAVAAEQAWRVVGTVAAAATPSADVQAAAYDDLKGRLLGHLQAAGRLDGVLLYLHGAMLAENAPDAEGDLCAAARQVIGPDVPLVTALDLHGNMTAEFCRHVDGAWVFDTNPHIDAYERGVEAAQALAAILNGNSLRPRVYISKPPMLPPTINMRTAEGPMVQLLARAREWEQKPGILNVAVFPGFPYADFADAGTSVLVTATDARAGQAAADDVGRLAWVIRHQFLKRIPTPAEAVQQALAAAPGQGPVVLADVSDNPGGGGSGDTTELLWELYRRGAKGAAACIWDPEAVRQAMQVGVGAEGVFHIGGKAAPGAYGAPLEGRGRVKALTDGQFTGWGPVVRGRSVDCGPTAVIDMNGLQLVVTSIRHAANDRGYFKMAGIEPEREPILVIKSRGHFRADFEPIARHIIEVDAPGAANPDLSRYRYRHLRRPIWPLDPDTQW